MRGFLFGSNFKLTIEFICFLQSTSLGFSAPCLSTVIRRPGLPYVLRRSVCVAPRRRKNQALFSGTIVVRSCRATVIRGVAFLVGGCRGSRSSYAYIWRHDGCDAPNHVTPTTVHNLGAIIGFVLDMPTYCYFNRLRYCLNDTLCSCNEYW